MPNWGKFGLTLIIFFLAIISVGILVVNDSSRLLWRTSLQTTMNRTQRDIRRAAKSLNSTGIVEGQLEFPWVIVHFTVYDTPPELLKHSNMVEGENQAKMYISFSSPSDSDDYRLRYRVSAAPNNTKVGHPSLPETENHSYT